MNRLLRALPIAALVGLAALLPACKKNPVAPPEGGAQPPKIEIGGELFPKQPMPKVERMAAGVEPVVVSQAVVQPDERVQVAAQVEGTVLLYGVELAGPPPVIDDNVIVRVVTVREKDGDKKYTYYFRRLRDGSDIFKDQAIVRLDEEMLAIQLTAGKRSFQTTKEAIKSAREQVSAADKYLKRLESVGSGASASELLSAVSQKARSEGEYAQTIREEARLQGEMEVTEFKWKQCFVRSPVDGKIVKILKNPGEGVKPGDPLMEVQSARRFRVEGKVDVQEANRIKLHMPAEVIPVRPVGPEPYSVSHRREVTAVAVTAHPGRPLVVSGGMDATALVWDVTTADKAAHVLPHPAGVGVRSVAVTGTGSDRHWAATGGTDGKLRLWDLSDPANLPKTPAAEFEEGHGSAITALALNADGRFLASAAGRDVIVWSLADRKKKYALPADHRDDVTSLRFTPQGTLVTVCRDKAVRVWAVGTDGATVAQLIDNRSGAVDVLGVSADGGKLLFDQDASRIDVVSLDDGRSIGSLLNGGGTRFAGLALFGPDDKLVLTAGGDTDSRGELQLWEIGRSDAAGAKKAAGPRATERRRLVTPNRVAVTAAAFSPDPVKRFVVVGTAAGGVHYWLPPAADDPYRTLRGKVTAILPADARSSTIRVEVVLPADVKADLLQDRGTANILIDPTDPPEPPQMPTPAPLPKIPGVGVPPPAGPILPAGGAVPVTK